MSKTKESLLSLLTVVAFLALTAIAVALLGGNSEQKAKVENNFLWQKARWALEFAFAFAPAVISPDNRADGAATETSSEFSDPYNLDLAPVADAVSTDGFWSGLVENLKSAWSQGAAEDGIESAVSDFGTSDSAGLSDLRSKLEEGSTAVAAGKIFDWQPSEGGTDFIFRRKNGDEYKISLPFRFFSKD